jgi:hypothetical protein
MGVGAGLAGTFTSQQQQQGVGTQGGALWAISQQQQQQQQRQHARDLETDDVPNERAEEYSFADVLARVKTNEMGAGEAAAAFEEACWDRAFDLRHEAASAVHRTVRGHGEPRYTQIYPNTSE